MEVTSPNFKNKEAIPPKFTCQGDDINPALVISDIPKTAKSLVLVVDDPDAPSEVWIHWVVFNIPVQTYIEENSVPGLQGINSFHKLGYGGPCPPSGTHRYYFKIYALDKMLDLPEAVSLKDLEEAMKNHILDKGQLIGLYRKE